MKNYYKGLSGLYFWILLLEIGELAELHNKKVLDYGCGLGKLRELYPDTVGYDIDPALTDVEDWRTVDFDTVVINQVFYEMEEKDIVKLLEELKSRDVTLVVGIGRKGWLNKLGARIFRKEAHDKYKTLPEKEKEILNRYTTIVKKKNVLWLSDIYIMKFKDLWKKQHLEYKEIEKKLI